MNLTKNGAGDGNVTSEPSGVTCPAGCTATRGCFAADDMVRLTATPSSGSFFSGWSGDCTGTGTCILPMGASHSVTATFSLVTFTLTVSVTTAGPGVSSMPAGIDNCQSFGCTASYAFGTAVTLSTPSVSDAVVWGTGQCNSHTLNTCTVVMSASKRVDATIY